MVERLGQLLPKILIVIAVGVAFDVILTLTMAGGTDWTALGRCRPEFLALAAILSLVPWVTNTLRIRIWSRFLGRPMSSRDALRTVLATDLGAAATPTAVGGGPLKMAMFIRHGFDPGKAAAIVFLASIEDGLFLLSAVPIALFLTRGGADPASGGAVRQWMSGAPPLLIVAVAAVILYFAARSLRRRVFPSQSETPSQQRTIIHRIREAVARFLRDARTVYYDIARRGRAPFALAMLCVAVQWCCRYSVVAALAWGVGLEVDPIRCFALQWVVYTTTMVIPTPGASGGAEASFLLVFSSILPPEIAGIIMAGWRLLTFHMTAILGAALFTVLESPEAFDTRRLAGGIARLFAPAGLSPGRRLSILEPPPSSPAEGAET